MSGFFDPFGNSSGGGGGASSKDEVARAEIAAIKDGETLDSFGDVETVLATKANTSTTYTKTEVDTAMSAKADKSTTYTKTEVDTALADKVDKETGKGLSTNDYTTAEKTKLAGIAEGAEVNEIEGIKVNNTSINPDANKVVNITVPTSAADVSALPDTTKYAVALSLTINSSTFVMTGQLKDQNGDNLGTAQTIDLPLESVVVGGSYNSQTKKVVLTLQNGNTIEFSVADLVSGLQTELSASNKLNPAYINYDSTHRAVSDTEKSTWNSKQNALSSTQLAAVNSGIDSAKVDQIEANKNNILTAYGGIPNKNKFNIYNLYNRDNLTVNEATGVCTQVTNDTRANLMFGIWKGSATVVAPTTITTNGIYYYSFKKNAGDTTIRFGHNGETISSQITYDISDFDNGTYTLQLNIINCVQANGKYSWNQVMICSRADYDADPSYQPYAMSNAELTAAEKQNENNISYNTDNGVKNTFDFANALQEAKIYTTVSKTATSLTVTANNPGVGASSVVYSGKNYPAGDYIFSCKITDYSCTTETAKIYISTSTAAGTGVANKTITGNGTIQIPFHWNGGKVYIKYFPNESNTANQFNTFTASENMIMLASISDTTYQPYAMSNAELTAQWSSKQVSKWATSFSVPNPSFGQGELIKLYVYGGNPASLAVYLITSNTVVPLTSTTGISYTIRTNTSVDFTTTSTCLAYYEYIRFAAS